MKLTDPALPRGISGRRILSAGVGVALTLLVALPAGGGPPSFDHGAETTWRPISWEDFQGKAPEEGRWSRRSSARIMTRIRLAPFKIETESVGEGFEAFSPKIEAYAFMDKLFSGVASSARNEKVLAHEQLHFDLTEAFARHLRADLRSLRVPGPTSSEAKQNFESAVQRLTDERMAILTALQRDYDGESDHGVKKKAQKAWAERITQLLSEAPLPVD